MKKLLLATLLTAATPLIHAETASAKGAADTFPVIEKFAGHLASRLDLTAAQREQIKTIFSEHQTKLSPLADSFRDEHKAWLDYSLSPSADPAESSARLDRALAIQKKLMLESASLRKDLRSLLDAGQLAKLESLRVEAGGRFDSLRSRIQDWLAR